MMKLIQSDSTDPGFNLALEQYVFDSLDRSCAYFMLWQNKNTVVVGKHQNTVAEINLPYVKEHNIRVVRRLSGGGAVYHDLGNVNFTFIDDCGETGAFDFSLFCRPVMHALERLGVRAELSGRNDMTIHGKKFSGNSQYVKQGRVMHHGTLLFDSNLDEVEQVLSVSKDKIESKGLSSVRSRVTNIRPYAADPAMDVSRFIRVLKNAMAEQFQMEEYALSLQDCEAILQLKERIYDRWDWNYGASPAYTIHKERRVEGCGKLEIYMDVREGLIREISFYGDFFGNGDPEELGNRLIGCPLEEAALISRLENMPISHYFYPMNRTMLVSILMQ